MIERGSPVGQASRKAERGWWWLGVALALVLSSAVGYFLLRMPIQLTDSLLPLLTVQRAPSVWHLFRSHLDSSGYMRPLWYVQVKLLFDAATGHYTAVFRIFHFGLLIMAFVLFVSLARVRSRNDFVALLFAAMALVGLHTFLGTVWEAYPINHYLEIVVLCLAAAHLSLARHRPWSDLAALAVFALAIFTLESGLLVWVCLITAYAAGARGVSPKGLVAATAVLAVYVSLRFIVFPQVGLPALVERNSGFGFSRLDPAELMARFGENPIWFYAYNVLCSALGVIFSEPRAGIWVFARSVTESRVEPWLAINIVSSVLATGLVGRAVVGRARRWRWRELDHWDRLLLLFVAVWLANAALSFSYTKDVIMSPAGAFYALAVFVAARDLLDSVTSRPPRLLAGAALSAVLLLTSATWSIRAVGVPFKMREMTFEQRNEWARAPRWLELQDVTLSDPRSQALVEQLRADAIHRRVPNPYFVARWAVRYVDQQP